MWVVLFVYSGEFCIHLHIMITGFFNVLIKKQLMQTLTGIKYARRGVMRKYSKPKANEAEYFVKHSIVLNE